MKRILTICFVLVAAGSAFGQFVSTSRTNTIYRKCAGISPVNGGAMVSIDLTGMISIRPCANKNVHISDDGGATFFNFGSGGSELNTGGNKVFSFGDTQSGGNSTQLVLDDNASSVLVNATSSINLQTGGNLILGNNVSTAIFGRGVLSSSNAVIDFSSVRVRNAEQIGFSSSATDASQALDTGIKRVVPSVAAVTDGGASNLGWLQTAGNLRVAANVTNATTSLANLTGLVSGNLSSGRTYSFTANIFVNDSTAADGVKLAFDAGTATVTDFRAHCLITDSALRTSSQVSALATNITAATITGDTIIQCSGTITVSSGGTFGVRQAQNAHSTGTLTNYRGSFLQLTDMQ